MNNPGQESLVCDVPLASPPDIQHGAAPTDNRWGKQSVVSREMALIGASGRPVDCIMVAL